MPIHQQRMVDWTTHQDHHGVRNQVTLTRIYRLIYRHSILSVLFPLKGILKQIIGWKTTHFNFPMMEQLGWATEKMDKVRYRVKDHVTWLLLIFNCSCLQNKWKFDCPFVWHILQSDDTFLMRSGWEHQSVKNFDFHKTINGEHC